MKRSPFTTKYRYILYTEIIPSYNLQSPKILSLLSAIVSTNSPKNREEKKHKRCTKRSRALFVYEKKKGLKKIRRWRSQDAFRKNKREREKSDIRTSERILCAHTHESRSHFFLWFMQARPLHGVKHRDKCAPPRGLMALNYREKEKIQKKYLYKKI